MHFIVVLKGSRWVAPRPSQADQLLCRQMAVSVNLLPFCLSLQQAEELLRQEARSPPPLSGNWSGRPQVISAASESALLERGLPPITLDASSQPGASTSRVPQPAGPSTSLNIRFSKTGWKCPHPWQLLREQSHNQSSWQLHRTIDGRTANKPGKIHLVAPIRLIQGDKQTMFGLRFDQGKRKKARKILSQH